MLLRRRWRKGWIALGACACTLAGCGAGGSQLCSLVGCFSGIDVLFGNIRTGFPDAQKVEVCANTVCTTYPAGPVSRLCGPETVTGKPTCEYVTATRHQRGVQRLVSIGLHSGWLEHATRMPLTITVLGAHERALFSARTVVEVTKTAPNGVRCGPVCFNGAVLFDPHSKRFTVLAGHRSLARRLEAEAVVEHDHLRAAP